MLVRRSGDFADAEDAVQEALLAAATQWPADGVPDNPRGWLVAVASRRLVDHVARRGRAPAPRGAGRRAESRPTAAEPSPGADDSLLLLFLCCHPALHARRRRSR